MQHIIYIFMFQKAFRRNKDPNDDQTLINCIIFRSEILILSIKGNYNIK